MQILNYNFDRAEKARINNNEKVSNYNKIEQTVFIVKSIVLIIMCLCLLAMVACIAFMLYKDPSMVNSPITLLMVITTGSFSVMFVGFFIMRKKPEYVSMYYYDNMETKYHRLLRKYKNVIVQINDDNSVHCLCEDYHRSIEAFSLKPKKIQKTSEVKIPSLDFKTDCLLIPA